VNALLILISSPQASFLMSFCIVWIEDVNDRAVGYLSRLDSVSNMNKIQVIPVKQKFSRFMKQGVEENIWTKEG
jgi:hypothetical protein